MDDKQTTPDASPEQSYDRRRGPRRAGAASVGGDERRRYERRKTPGVTALLDDVLNTRVDIEPSEGDDAGHTA